ncbi:dolichyl-P-Man:Man(5)GlcNAc(2)-PP-dolichol alpha-1,3-mannosyltransferase [Coemansia sp. RSA 2706]|nr:dolichyl-P-Man:Man(5)GlcNAc(2)-PP-dolichol alpha-1,3-mannosyltransferase [Coemansia sp. RSA 2711]KAJ2305588.1 dolichyl-P-Man:Man(5)GlcNAc(2)-PP-dolichol alpha-1,3-mannosyltransferase [Coemansia sp. RSA 2706]KAJ2318621.1 dolichyl-P-Man:Man(5)GlcNAc(2)-PP-dolichol alpha-1,3-mannosyltransferase [Coemansia sp. RSA 2704]KAJ2734903.1 dolichyl-P-Man:Man(5)GlcNAc(2)-PP-dolichol alpha-1,3-mannosyltransferase [Coemansia sp. Cherry 401B]
MADVRPWIHRVLFTQQYFVPIAVALFIFDSLLTFMVIRRVAYTEIDWRTYMQQIAGVLRGERNYAKLSGDTGPLVYPAGFVWAYQALWTATDEGADVRRAQYLFMLMYLATLGVVLAIYRGARVPPVWLPLLSASRRLHSIYVLRLFNDAVAMLLAYAAILAMSRRPRWSGLLLSLAISIKMNVQLMLPAAAFIWWRAGGLRLAAVQTAVVALSQAVVAAPFLAAYPHEYLAGAFDYGRKFNYTWTVNWRFLGLSAFESRAWAQLLLVLHALLLAVLAAVVWPRLSGHSLWQILRQGFRRSTRRVSAAEVAVVMFTANFVGIVCARSLHYQFYAWYAHMLPLLLFYARLPTPLRLALWLAIEYAWNVFPSTSFSSLLLLAAHITLLFGIFRIRHAKPN